MDTSVELSRPEVLLQPKPKGSELFWENLDAILKTPVTKRFFLHGGVLGFIALATKIPVKEQHMTQPNNMPPEPDNQPKKENPQQPQAPDQKITYPTEVISQYEIYKKDLLRIKNTKRWEKTIELVVADPRLRLSKSDQAFWKQRMQEITFVESSGIPDATSVIGCFGLTQLNPSTAAEEARKYGIQKYDLNNGWDNLMLGLIHQLGLAQRYGRELAGWTHHLGSGNMDNALRTYLLQDRSLKIKDVDEIFRNPNSNQKISKIIEENKITAEKLLNSAAVTGKLKQINAFNDDTAKYSIRLQAAGLAMNLAGS